MDFGFVKFFFLSLLSMIIKFTKLKTKKTNIFSSAGPAAVIYLFHFVSLFWRRNETKPRCESATE